MAQKLISGIESPLNVTGYTRDQGFGEKSRRTAPTEYQSEYGNSVQPDSQCGQIRIL